MLVNLFDPVFDVFERFFICNGVHQDNTNGPFVICLVNIFVSFLAGSVPYLKLDFASLNVNHLDLEIDSDRGCITNLEITIAKP